LSAAAVVMPWLASRKRQLAAITSSSALKADAAESALCGYMAWIALVGLVINAIWGKSWADPAAALALAPLIIREGWEAVRPSRPGCPCPPI
jgi:divalent metal cation (Fe/Co/Zn/Cd) transporter